MKKSGLADSPLFQMPQQAAQPAGVQTPTQTRSSAVVKRPQKRARKQVQKADTVIPRHHETTHDTVIPRHHETIIETIRKAVREFGKEAATHRFTVAEKKAVREILFSYENRHGIVSSENEIARIAINYLVKDYEEHGENSILHQALLALNA